MFAETLITTFTKKLATTIVLGRSSLFDGVNGVQR